MRHRARRNTVQDIIEEAGGDLALSHETKVTQFAIRMWRTRGIPERYWALLSRKTGLDVVEIAGASERARKRERK